MSRKKRGAVAPVPLRETRPMQYHRPIRIYTVRLANGHTWGVCASVDTMDWAVTLARLMGLSAERDEADTLLRLERVDPVQVMKHRPWWVPSAGYPGNGWHVRISPGLELWRHPQVKESIAVLHDDRDRATVAMQMRYALYPLYESTVMGSGLPLHAALIEKDGMGILLAGRSGVGKSTASSRIPAPWKPLGDDFALVVRDGRGCWHAHPLPTWSAVASGGNAPMEPTCRSLPLAAVFFLVQSEKDERVDPGRGAASVMMDEAAMMVLRSIESSDEPVQRLPIRRRIFENAASLAAAVPCFLLRLSLTGRFWERIEEILEWKKGTVPFSQCSAG
jgi:SynChlorMet cassette protein ScmC